MTDTHPLLSDFNNLYASSSDYPEAATENIPDDAYCAIDGGNQSFFAEFERDMPLTHRALLTECSPLQLLEIISKSASIGSPGKTAHLYWWGAICAKRLLLVNLPSYAKSHPLQKAAEKKYLTCLPEKLHCFYQGMNGMSLCEGHGALGYDLPRPRSDWDEIGQFCRNRNIELKNDSRLTSDFHGAELRVIMAGSKSDLILTDFTNKNRTLYHVHDYDFDDYREVKNPAETLDRYFANAIQGFSEPVSLR